MTTAVDKRSEAILAKLHPALLNPARLFVTEANASLAPHGCVIKLISGLRTFEEQNALYAKGRTVEGKRVTNARGGYSNHNFGIAFDVGVFTLDGKYLGESPHYAAIAPIAKKLGFEWGGDWVTFKDTPHYQLRPKWAAGMSEQHMLAELRRMKNNHIDPFAAN